MNFTSIPLIFAITGHRDLRVEDIPALKQSIESIFTRYREKYPHTQLIILSALAEGSDMLVAEVALSMGITLQVVLPFEKHDYLNTFSNTDAQKQFEDLYQQAHKITNLNYHPLDDSISYDNLGKHLSENCDILLAMWDGVLLDSKGGTSQVIKFLNDGSHNNHFDLLDGNAMITINTPRQSHPEVDEPFAFKEDYLGNTKTDFHGMLRKIDAINADFTGYAKTHTDRSLIHNTYEYFDQLANNHQAQYKRYFKLILITSLLAFASLEAMHVLHIEEFTFGYGIGLTIAFAIYHRFLRSGKIQENFIFYRTFSEALRVQNAWNYADIRPQDQWQVHESIANHILTDSHVKFTWAKILLKNICYLDNTHFRPKYETDRYNELEWINGQCLYYQRAIKSRTQKLSVWEKIEHLFHTLGLITMVMMLAIFNLEYFAIVKPGGLWFDWHLLILISGISLLTAAFIGEKYLKVEAYQDEIYDFKLMLSHFTKARELIAQESKDSPEYKEIIFHLGIQNLKENTKWLVLHDSRRAKAYVD